MEKPPVAYSAEELLQMQKERGAFGNNKCPICGKSDFDVNSEVLTIQLSSGNLAAAGFDRALPVLISLCKNCGNLQFFNATIVAERR